MIAYTVIPAPFFYVISAPERGSIVSKISFVWIPGQAGDDGSKQ